MVFSSAGIQQYYITVNHLYEEDIFLPPNLSYLIQSHFNHGGALYESRLKCGCHKMSDLVGHSLFLGCFKPWIQPLKAGTAWEEQAPETS